MQTIKKINQLKHIFNKQYNRFAVHKLYTEEHEWILIDDQTSVGKVGITKYAEEQLGDIVHVEFPSVGQSFQKNDVFGTLESVKMAADLFIPMSGEIQSTNDAIEQNFSEINTDPENNWIVEIKCSDLKEIDKLMNNDQYENFLKTIV